MTDRQNRNSRFGLALEAIGNLWEQGFTELRDSGDTTALVAHDKIEHASLNRKDSVFHTHLIFVRTHAVSLLAETYRRCFKLALAHPQQAGLDPHEWGLSQLQPAIRVTFAWICDWYTLACDGENDRVRHGGSIEIAPGQTATLSVPTSPSPSELPESWRAPAWLFSISPLVGIGPLKTKHVPANDSEQKLSAAYTRLLLKGARRSFLWQLRIAIDEVRNEETVAAGAIPAELVNRQARGPNKRKGWERRVKLYDAIEKVLNDSPGLQGLDFCAALDKRHAPPLFDWVKNGDWREGLTWKEAWSNSRLKGKIRRVRQEAMKNR